MLEVIFDYLWWCQLTSKEWLICKTCLKIWKGTFYKLSYLQSVLALKRVWWENANLIFFTTLLPTCKMFLSFKCKKTWLWLSLSRGHIGIMSCDADMEFAANATNGIHVKYFCVKFSRINPQNKFFFYVIQWIHAFRVAVVFTK